MVKLRSIWTSLTFALSPTVIKWWLYSYTNIYVKAYLGKVKRAGQGVRTKEAIFHQNFEHIVIFYALRPATPRWMRFCFVYLTFCSGYLCTTTTTITVIIISMFDAIATTLSILTRANRPGVLEECLTIASLLTGVTTWVTAQVSAFLLKVLTNSFIGISAFLCWHQH